MISTPLPNSQTGHHVNMVRSDKKTPASQWQGSRIWGIVKSN